MDYLLLLPGPQRVVIEVDGKHHFSEGETPSLNVYRRDGLGRSGTATRWI